MKRFALVGSVTIFTLAGCGLISSPPINNPFGLEGQQTTINLGPSSAATGTLSANATFNDETLSLPFNPTGFVYNLAISGVSLSGTNCPSPLPTRINVTMSLILTVSDNPSTGPREASATADNVQFTLTQSGSGYTVGSISNGSLSFSNLQTLLDILQTGGPNTASLDGTVNTTSTPDLAGCAMTITWGGGQGVLKF